MSRLQQMLNTHPLNAQDHLPVADGMTKTTLLATIESLRECAQLCTMCADSSLGADDVAALKDCVRLALDCADMCSAVAGTLARRTAADPNYARSAVELCRLSCSLCAQECEKHPGLDACRVCAEACRRAEKVCTELLTDRG